LIYNNNVNQNNSKRTKLTFRASTTKKCLIEVILVQLFNKTQNLRRTA